MKIRTCLFLLVLLHCNSLLLAARPAVTSIRIDWNSSSAATPLVATTKESFNNGVELVLDPGKDLALPLARPLTYERSCDCYSLSMAAGEGLLTVLGFWRTPRGFYRTASSPYLELEDLGSLKMVTGLSGTKYLFAVAGDGEWHCVSVRDVRGNGLLIDYRPDGFIERVRDSRDRQLMPNYQQQRIVSLTQTWKSGAILNSQTFLIN